MAGLGKKRTILTWLPGVLVCAEAAAAEMRIMDNMIKARFNDVNLILLHAIYKLFLHKFLKTKGRPHRNPAFLGVKP